MELTQETRKTSFKRVEPTLNKRKQVILDILGDKEMTAEEIAEELFQRGITNYYDRNSAAPRITEMYKDEILTTTGKRKCTKTGRQVAVWKKVQKNE